MKDPKKEQDNNQEEIKEEKTDLKHEIIDWIRTIAIVVLVVVLLQNFVIINAKIPSASMENTIMTGDHIFGFRLSYLTKDPERYDVVIFRYPLDEEKLFIKRIIGLPGDTLVVDEEGKVYLDDPDGTLVTVFDDGSYVISPEAVPLDDSFCPEPTKGGSKYGSGVYHVPEGQYFMMGDNRNHSNDSRFWGCVEKKKILGKAWLRYWPITKIKLIK